MAPWQAKAAIQFILAHVAGGERVNNALQRWNGSFSCEAVRGRVRGLARIIPSNVQVTGKSVVEIGTGWDAVNPIMLALFGAKRIYTYDHVRHLRYDLAMNVVRTIGELIPDIAAVSGYGADELQERLGPMTRAKNLRELLENANIVYVAPGDAARTDLPGASVDLVYSYAVLEHVSEETIAAINRESRRILVRNGTAHHHIGLHDHYVSFDSSISRVNFLKYPEWWWRFVVKNKISYHNRLREPQILELFRSGGAKVESNDHLVDPRDVAAVKAMKIDRRFAGLTPEQLAVTAMTVTLSYPRSSSGTTERDRVFR